jgi:hypothetical protein
MYDTAADFCSRSHYNYMRDGYDSATGRYTQSDPKGQGFYKKHPQLRPEGSVLRTDPSA